MRSISQERRHHQAEEVEEEEHDDMTILSSTSSCSHQSLYQLLFPIQHQYQEKKIQE